MIKPANGENGQLNKTERLGWVSVVMVGCAMIPAVLIAAGVSHPLAQAALVLLLGGGLVGLIGWYTRVRGSVRKLNDLISGLYAKARAQEEENQNLAQLRTIQKASMRMASHQLRAPLAALQSCLSVLMQAEDIEAEDAHKLLADAAARGGDMMELVNDILGLAESESMVRIETDVDSEDIDVEKAVRDIVNFFSPRAKERGVTYRIDIKNPPGILRANRKLFNQVVLNLVSNAFRYSDQGREVVVILDSPAEDRLVLEVKNWGLVIAPEDRERIFEEFWRSDEARKRVSRGTGLGLSIVRNIIEYRGGSIHVQSDAENGTRFIVDIPRHRKGVDHNGKGKT
jgi:two-component system phosphate regulon sensor histidine kinase PhoR